MSLFNLQKKLKWQERKPFDERSENDNHPVMTRREEVIHKNCHKIIKLLEADEVDRLEVFNATDAIIRQISNWFALNKPKNIKGEPTIFERIQGEKGE